jgi:DNA replication and repair protein RecF
MTEQAARLAVDTATTAARLRTLSIHDFRNLGHVELEAPDAGFVVVGENGHGKTNLLEAIYYCHLFRSMRGARDEELVRFGTRGFHVGSTASGAPCDTIGVGYDHATRRKKIVLDGVECARLSDALGALPGVVFSPTDVTLVSGGPALRRRFLDVMLASSSRRYLQALQQYRTALLHRNAALRVSARLADATARIRVWEAPLARYGAILRCERETWIAWARAPFARLCAAIGEREPADLRARSSVALDESCSEDAAAGALAAAIAGHRDRDLQRGMTQVGPHRDDLEFRLGAHATRSFGSAGQHRTAAIAVRLLERRTYRERSGREPLVLLDDPFAELDAGRARSVLGLLVERHDGQAVFAVPRPDDIPEALTGLPRFRIRDGVLTRAAGGA